MSDLGLIAAAVLLPTGATYAALSQARWTRLRRQLVLARADRSADGFATLSAAAQDFPALLEIAESTDHHLCLGLLRLSGREPAAQAASINERTRRHEALYRVDANLFALLVLTRDRAAAVQAVSRLVGDTDRVECGMCDAPEQARNLADSLLIASRRFAPAERFLSAACELDALPAS